MKKTPLKKISNKKKNNKEGIQKIENMLKEKDTEMYLTIWKTRAHICISCLKYLGDTPKSYNFDHILEKSKYPNLRHIKDNIALLCFECHEKKTRGFPTKKYSFIIDNIKKKFL